jgi:predicted ATP-grasp superfamily ATP-dependent carboligase
MREEVYSRLQENLDTFFIGAPESDDLLEILRIRFTSQEGETALILGNTPKDITILAREAATDEDAAQTFMEVPKELVAKVRELIAKHSG